MTRVLIVDDHQFFRAGLQSALEAAGYVVSAAVGDGFEALQAIDEFNPDLLILDLRMPNCDGVETIKAMRKAGDGRPVIVLATEIDDKSLAGITRAGVNAILYKFGSEVRLFDAIKSALDGAHFFDRDIFERVLALANSTPPAANQEALSDRERAIVEEVVSGKRNREIASKFNITEGTVKVHLHNIYSKIGVKNRTELALKAKIHFPV